MNKNFWKDKRVLITGFEGFLGSNLTKHLLSTGACIVGLDKEVNREKTLLTKDDYSNIAVVKGNIANLTLVEKVIADYKIEAIFHGRVCLEVSEVPSLEA